jgi:transposase
MVHYVGLDVSLKQTSICVVSDTGSIVREGVVDSDPEAIAAFVRSNAPNAVRVGLESGPTATWLWTELRRLGVPVICIDARHAKAVLKMQINKSDRNDAVGIARIMQTGWFKEVRVKDLDCHVVKALLTSRALLVKIKRDLENQIRGLLKNLGRVIGRAKFNGFAARAAELIEDRPELVAVVAPLLKAREAIEKQIDDLDRKVLKLARHDAQIRRFMTVPGIGPITALCFKATIDDPARFKRSRSVGAYIGLTSRRHASGEIDWSGRISKCGDTMLRSYLFEAAGVLLTRVPKWSALKAWGMRLASEMGFARPRSPSPVSSPSSCIACGSTEPNSLGRTARLPRNKHRSSVPAEAGKDVPARTMAVVRSSDFLRALDRRDRACNIDPPTSSYAIMRRARPYRGENTGPGRDDRRELDT